MGGGRGRDTNYFFNFEKSRANSKMMEKVTDENWHTVTKRADVINVQRYFFSNLYIKKIHGDEMEENMRHFYEKHSNSNNLGNTEG